LEEVSFLITALTLKIKNNYLKYYGKNMKNEIYFITGNQEKADYLVKFLGVDLKRKNIDLDEIQSMSLQKIVQHKVREAYESVKAPVLVEDVALEFEALSGLPGPFIKFFIDNMKLQDVCDLLGDKKRTATAKCVFGYFDGEDEKYFIGELVGEIAKKPKGRGGYGWDKIFIPNGYNGRTRAELNPREDKETYLKIKPFDELKEFLEKL
jgi:non-canonical purine NTP pyrophosphatase (RdgB/HAM1 family)